MEKDNDKEDKFNKPTENNSKPIFLFIFNFTNRKYDLNIKDFNKMIEVILQLFKDTSIFQCNKLTTLYEDQDKDPIELNSFNFNDIVDYHQRTFKGERMKIIVQDNNFIGSSIFNSKNDYILAQSNIVGLDRRDYNRFQEVKENNSKSEKDFDELKNEIAELKNMVACNKEDVKLMYEEIMKGFEQRMTNLLIDHKKKQNQINIEENFSNDSENNEKEDSDLQIIESSNANCSYCISTSPELKCVICNKINLCSSCFLTKKHNYHPLITIHYPPHFNPENISMVNFSSINLLNYNQQIYFKNNSKFFGNRANHIDIRITHLDKSHVSLNLNSNESCSLILDIFNSSNSCINEQEILITSKDNLNVKVDNALIHEKIKKQRSLAVNLNISAPINSGSYEFKIIALHLSRKIECDALKIKIEVKASESVEGASDRGKELEVEEIIQMILKEHPSLVGVFTKNEYEIYLFLNSQKNLSLKQFIKLMQENNYNTDLVISKYFP